MVAYSRGYVPCFLAVFVGHDLMCDPRLPLTGTQGKAEALEDDGAEVRQLFDLVDGKRRRNIGKGRVELGSHLREDMGVGKKMNGHYLGKKIFFLVSFSPVSRRQFVCVFSPDARSKSRMWFPCLRWKSSEPLAGDGAVSCLPPTVCCRKFHRTPFWSPFPRCAPSLLVQYCSTIAAKPLSLCVRP